MKPFGQEKCKIVRNWHASLKDNFNTLLVDLVFRSSSAVIVIAFENGIVRTYQLPNSEHDSSLVVLKETSCVETKGGPIQALAAGAICRQKGCEVIAADSRGLITILSNQQILSRKSVSQHAVQFTTVDEDALGNIAIVTGDSEGSISAFTLYDDLWKLRLGDIRYCESLSSHVQIGHLLAVELTNTGNQKTNYVLAADNNRTLYFLQQGTVVLALKTPDDVTAMCCGWFLEPEQTDGNADTSLIQAHSTQVALGCHSGAIYILSNFHVYPEQFANVQKSLSVLHRVPSSTDSHCVDSLLCAGNFNTMCLLKEGRELCTYTMPAWVNSIAAPPTQCTSDGYDIVVGCVDRSVHGLRIEVT